MIAMQCYNLIITIIQDIFEIISFLCIFYTLDI